MTGILTFLAELVVLYRVLYKELQPPLRPFAYLRNCRDFVTIAFVASRLPDLVCSYLLIAMSGGVAVMFLLKYAEDKFWKEWKMQRDEMKKSKEMAQERAEQERLGRKPVSMEAEDAAQLMAKETIRRAREARDGNTETEGS